MSAAPRRTVRVVAALWGVALVGAFALVVAGTRDDPEILCPDAPQVEGSGLQTGLQLWPPGTVECVYRAPDGTVSRSTHFPWAEWGAIALFALVVAAAIYVLTRRREP